MKSSHTSGAISISLTTDESTELKDDLEEVQRNYGDLFPGLRRIYTALQFHLQEGASDHSFMTWGP